VDARDKRGHDESEIPSVGIRSASSTRFRRSIRASTVIPGRFTLAIVISGAKRYSLRGFREQSNSIPVDASPGSAMADIFVSYAKIDRSLASKLVAMLEAEGWKARPTSKRYFKIFSASAS